MQLTAYYRVTPGSNGKPRPPWFSRAAAMRSFLVAADRAGAEVVVVADGGVPDELRPLVPGRVVPVRGGSAPKGFRRLLDVVDATDGLVWFAEDDYAYLPHALTAVQDAARALPQADLFGVYTPDNAAWHADHASQPGHRGPEERFDVGGRAWRRAWDSTSTFGLRAEAFRQDRALLRLCSRAGGPWDHTCVLTLQGEPAYPLRHLSSDLYLRPSRASAGRVVTRPLVRALVDVVARSRSRLWVAPVDDLATHVEPGYLSPSADWEQVLTAS